MQPAAVLRAAVRTPLIKFLGKRTPTPHAPAAHPMAPEDIAANFSSFLAKSQASGAPAAGAAVVQGRFIPLYPASKKTADYEDWEAPAYLRHRPEMTEREIEAVMSGGATDIRTGP